MYRIAIVEDEQAIIDYLRFLIEKQNIDDAIAITEYTSTQDYPLEKKNFDLIFLDIGMSFSDKNTLAKNGMELAKEIRKQNKSQPLIIFVTGLFEYVYEAFDVHAFHYLPKPINEAKFAEVFQSAIAYIKNEKEKKMQVLQIRYANSNKIIPLCELSYIESFNHKIILHTNDQTIEYYARISDLELELAGQFFRIHKGYLINLAYVDSYTKTEVVLTNGVRLMISKYKYTDFAKAYLKFIKNEEK